MNSLVKLPEVQENEMIYKKVDRHIGQLDLIGYYKREGTVRGIERMKETDGKERQIYYREK